MEGADRGTVVGTCVTQALHRRTRSSDARTGIDKAAVDAIVVTPDGVEGDRVLDTRHHGGHDKAVYAYSQEDADWWAEQLSEAVPPGRFGENLRIAGVDVSDAVIGQRWQVGADVQLEVSEPRVPCSTFQHHMDDRPGWVRWFTQVGRTGTYLRVLQGGRIAPGDPVVVTHTPAHGVTVRGWFTAGSPADARALLDAEVDGWQLAGSLRDAVVAALRD